MISIYACADGLFRTEVKRRAGNRCDLPCRDQGRSDRCERICIDHNIMAENVLAARPGQIEIAVLSQVYRGGFRSRGSIVADELVLVGQAIADNSR